MSLTTLSGFNVEFIYITQAPDEIRLAQAAGVDRVMIDLEINGKVERQGHLNTVISRHSLNDVVAARYILDTSKLMVRVNPIFSGSKAEIDACIAAGAEILMLPMFGTTEEVQTFVELVNGRARISLLLETTQALARIDQILALPGIDEVHVGLNDLHLGLGLDFMFEPLAGGLVDFIADRCRARNMRFGIGGVATLGAGRLPAEDILAEHVRLGSSQVILSRAFRAVLETGGADSNFAVEVRRIRDFLEQLARQEASYFEKAHGRLVERVSEIAHELRSARG
jgi:2-keto-3-deoxy-L-rhamnonate aldolase RhmA